METLSRPVLFDGAMGTYLEQEYGIPLGKTEEANLLHPETITDVHRKYIASGADAILTNTYAANTVLLDAPFEHVERIIDAASDNARAAVPEDRPETRIFACIGPIYGKRDPLPEYRAIIDRFLANGMTDFMLQTFPDPEHFGAVAEYLKSRQPDAFLMCLGTVGTDGYSPDGVPAQRFFDMTAEIPQVDVAGFNCTCGPAHMLHIFEQVRFRDKPAAAMPNAGFPNFERGRTVYSSSPDYFAQIVASIARLGVQYVGGCCGTDPAHIAATSRALADIPEIRPASSGAIPAQAKAAPQELPKKHFVAVELDPPADPAAAHKFFSRAVQVRDAGADLVTIADCPVGRARGDSSLLASILQQKYGIEAMPHLTCRDRNINASKALLLGLHMVDVSNVLVVTGDPVPAKERERIQTVFQFNSVRLAEYIRSLNEAEFASRPFRISGALNVNAVSFPSELEHARRKVEAGVQMLLTQPVMDTRAKENLIQAREELGVPILAGIMPVISYRNACFVNNEMGGISVPPDVVEAYRDVSRERASELAVKYALENATSVRDDADGFYLITTLGRADIVSSVVKEIKSWS